MLACSAVGVIIQLVHVYLYGEEQSIGEIIVLSVIFFVFVIVLFTIDIREPSDNTRLPMFCNSIPCRIDFVNSPCLLALACSLIAHHTTSLADTLESELGILFQGMSDPRNKWKKSTAGDQWRSDSDGDGV